MHESAQLWFCPCHTLATHVRLVTRKCEREKTAKVAPFSFTPPTEFDIDKLERSLSYVERVLREQVCL
jgi:hypothetical protein